MGDDLGKGPPPGYRVQPVERGNGYAIYLVLLEMPGALHQGFVVSRGSVSVPKGVLASHLRSLAVKGVETVAAPPAGSNALFMTRLGNGAPPSTLETLARAARRYLEAEGFFSDPTGAPAPRPATDR